MKEVIDRFQSLNNTKNCTFISFHVEGFYPCLSGNPFEIVILFAKKYTAICDEDIIVIMQSRKTVLFYDGSPRSKKDNNEVFDILMDVLMEQNAVT